MQKAKIVVDFLLPADQQTPSPVRPGVCAFDDPASGFPVAMFLGRGVVVLSGNVVDVAATCGSLAHGVGVVPFVGAKMLSFSLGRSWALDGNTSQGLTDQGLVMRIG